MSHGFSHASSRTDTNGRPTISHFGPEDDSGDIALALSLPRSRSDRLFFAKNNNPSSSTSSASSSYAAASPGSHGYGSGLTPLSSIPGQQPLIPNSGDHRSSTLESSTGARTTIIASSSSRLPPIPSQSQATHLSQQHLNKQLPEDPLSNRPLPETAESSSNAPLPSASAYSSDVRNGQHWANTPQPRDISANLPTPSVAKHSHLLLDQEVSGANSSSSRKDFTNVNTGKKDDPGSMPNANAMIRARQELVPTSSPSLDFRVDPKQCEMNESSQSSNTTRRSAQLPLPSSSSHAARPSTSSPGSPLLSRSQSLNVRIPRPLLTSSRTVSTSATTFCSHGGPSTSTSSNSTTSRLVPSSSSPLSSPADSRQPASATTPFSSSPSMKLGFMRRPGEPRPPPLVGDDVSRSMNRWVKEIVVCNFDLERGPVIERRAMGKRWGPGEKENVAFSSFPDTSLFSEGSITFSFKIRHMPPDASTLSLPEPPSPLPESLPSVETSLLNSSQSASSAHFDLPSSSAVAPRLRNDSPTVSPMKTGPVLAAAKAKAESEDKSEEYRKWDERGREWLFGFVWFEQRRDRGLARGYMQKSVVILTHFSFPALFFAVLDRIAPSFFEYGYSALEVACHSIASWPDPISDKVLELPVLSDLLTVKLPDSTESPQIGRAFGPSSLSGPTPVLASLPRSTPLRAFASFLPSLWSLWECLVLAEPVLVIAPDPQTCSEIVWWLRELMRPIPPAGDFRPYLHIHDHDFSLLINSNKPQAGVVVGVTNPFFRNAASHWPNVISIPPDRPKRPGQANSGTGLNTHSGSIPSPRPGQDLPEGFISKRQRSVQKDRALLKRLEALVAEGRLDDPDGNDAMRMHFQQLTEKMLVPLNRYFQTLVPNRSPIPSPSPSPVPQIDHSGLSSSKSTSATPSPSTTTHSSTMSTIRPFSLPSFLAHLRATGPNPLLFRTKGLSTKSRVENDFYASFCMGGSFAGWLAGRVQSLGSAVAEETERLAAAIVMGEGGVGAGGDTGLTVPSAGTSRPVDGRGRSRVQSKIEVFGSSSLTSDLIGRRTQQSPPVGLGISSPPLGESLAPRSEGLSGDGVIDIGNDDRDDIRTVGQGVNSRAPISMKANSGKEEEDIDRGSRRGSAGSGDTREQSYQGIRELSTTRTSEESPRHTPTGDGRYGGGIGCSGGEEGVGGVGVGFSGYDLYARRPSDGAVLGGLGRLNLGPK